MLQILGLDIELCEFDLENLLKLVERCFESVNN
jgi:hypothetical protein